MDEENFQPIRSTTQIKVVTRHQYGISVLNFLRRLFAGKSVVALQNVDCFLRLQNALRVVTKISSCQGNTTSRRRIKQLGISFFLFFFYFPMKIAEGHVRSSRGEIPGPSPLNDSPGSTCINWLFYPANPTVQLCITKKILSFPLAIPHKNPLRNKQKTLLASGHKET